MPSHAPATTSAPNATRLVVPGPPPLRSGSRDLLRDAALTLAIGTIVVGALGLACGSAEWSHIFIPGSKVEFPGWMAGPLAHLGPQLGPRALGPGVAAMFAAYIVVYSLANRIPPRVLFAVVIAVDVILTLGPPLLSADVFGYIGYARLEVVHSLNPYTNVIKDAPLDPIIKYSRWHSEVTPYGPLFTLLTYALVPLGIAANLWALKGIALIACLICAALVWRLAERHQVDQRRALVFFALNPILLVYALGGAHNDLILMAGLLAGFLWVLQSRPAAAATMLVSAVAVKATAGIYLPFAFIGTRNEDKKRFLVYGAATVAVVAALSTAFFGDVGVTAIAGQILHQQRLVATGSVPMQLSLLFGYNDLAAVFRLGALAVLLASFAYLIYRSQKTGEWLAGAGWTALVLVVTTAWLTPWYIIWSLPIAAVAGSKRLVTAVMVVTAYLIMTYTILPFVVHTVR